MMLSKKIKLFTGKNNIYLTFQGFQLNLAKAVFFLTVQDVPINFLEVTSLDWKISVI
jgi:hypothetical protein